MANNPVLILTHNCLELTKKCVESVALQDIPTTVFVYDNGSTDGTRKWLEQSQQIFLSHNINAGVSHGWNIGLDVIFNDFFCDYCLVINNDTQLPPYFYSELLSYDLPFVTGISVDEPNDHPHSWHQPAEHPDFSAFLIKKTCYQEIGPFDEKMKYYASDNDYHIRAHLCGIKLMNAGVPFHHERSSTIRLANKEDREEIETQAHLDRETFKGKYGFYPWDQEYSDFFSQSSTQSRR